MVSYAKPAILDHLGSSHCVIEASAGTGKTYTLEHLVVQFLLDEVPLEKILVVTFTKKATLELVSRVRAKLEELVALGTDVGREGEPVWEISERQKELLRQALNGFDRATISTIHGFCQQVLKDAAFEGARLFQQEAISTEDGFHRVFLDQLRTRFAAEDRSRLELAIAHMKGLGKLEKLLREAYKERECLDLPAPEEPRSALTEFPVHLAEAFIAEASGGPLRAAFKAAGCTSAATLKAMGVRLQMVLQGLADASAQGIPEAFWTRVDIKKLREQEQNFSLPGLTGEAEQLGKAYARLLRLDAKLLWVAAFLPPLLESLERYKLEEGLYDFDDMIGQVHRAVMQEGGDSLVQRLRERFQVALIDEFQDTDRKQWEIFRKVFLQAGPSHRLILVGDPKQAIYGFRSGDLPTYTQAIQAVGVVSGRDPLQLTTNFRSTPEVIEAYNDILRGHEGDPFFTGGNVNHYKGDVTCGRRGLKLLDPGGNPLSAIQVVDVVAGQAGRTKRACARALAQELKRTIGHARFGEVGKAELIRPGDVFVLTRTTAEGLIMSTALKEAGIPAAFYKQEGLFDGPEAAACRDLLLAIDAPHHEGRRVKALLGPFFGLSFAEAEGCRELPENHLILRRLSSWRDLAAKGRFGEFFHRIVSDSGMTQRLLFLEDGQRTLTNLFHILELLQQEAVTRHCTVLDMAVQVQRWIDGTELPSVEDGKVQRLERESGAVQILTMHKSKGLEAPVVVLFGGLSKGQESDIHRYHLNGCGERRAWVGPVDSAPEDVKRWIQMEDEEEGERLLYVALTRAKARLILPCYRLGSTLPSGNSSFDRATGDPKGPYCCVNRRLRTLLGTEELPKEHRHIQSTQAQEIEPMEAGELATRLADWQPVLPPALPLPDFRTLAVAGRPTWLWSFTGLQKGLEKFDQEVQDELLDPSQGTSDGSRRGAKLGSCVHTGFQQVDLKTFDGRGLEEWKQDPRIQSMAQACLTVEDPDEALSWIHAGLGGELPLPGGGTVVVANAERILRELDFMTPYPGQKDFLHGSMDVLFQMDGKAYLLDWKTNDLRDWGYGPESLQAKMDKEYILQVKVYTLAVCRFLGFETREAYEQGFGGVLYVFLRGLPDAGVWTCLPTWEEVQAWEQELKALPIERLVPVHAGGAKDA